jgi:hypothetical protein
MHIRILQCEKGFYQLVDSERLLIRTRDKRAVEYYYAQACEHYSSSSEPYVCSIAEPYTHVSNSSSKREL